MASDTDICNLAISHLGVGKEIADINTETGSQEASACRRYFDEARDAVLRDFPWPFATKIVALGLVEEDPTEEWAFSYRYPTDCVMIRKIQSGARTDSRQSRLPYRISRDDDGLLIYTDQDDAILEYTMREDIADRYSPDFVFALSWRLAFYIAPRLTGGDPFKLADRALKMYQLEISRAEANASNEEQPDQNVEAEWITGRN